MSFSTLSLKSFHLSSFYYFLSHFIRASASLYLEKQMKNVEGIVSGFENQLAKDGAILSLHQTNAIQSCGQELQVQPKTH